MSEIGNAINGLQRGVPIEWHVGITVFVLLYVCMLFYNYWRGGKKR